MATTPHYAPIPGLRPELELARERVYAALPMLDERDAEVLILRFGLDPHQTPRVIDEVAEHFGVSRETIIHIEQRAVFSFASDGLTRPDDIEPR